MSQNFSFYIWVPTPTRGRAGGAPRLLRVTTQPIISMSAACLYSKAAYLKSEDCSPSDSGVRVFVGTRTRVGLNLRAKLCLTGASVWPTTRSGLLCSLMALLSGGAKEGRGFLFFECEKGFVVETQIE